jgi:hypothetical protein
VEAAGGVVVVDEEDLGLLAVLGDQQGAVDLAGDRELDLVVAGDHRLRRSGHALGRRRHAVLDLAPELVELTLQLLDLALQLLDPRVFLGRCRQGQQQGPEHNQGARPDRPTNCRSGRAARRRTWFQCLHDRRPLGFGPGFDAGS